MSIAAAAAVSGIVCEAVDRGRVAAREEIDAVRGLHEVGADGGKTARAIGNDAEVPGRGPVGHASRRGHAHLLRNVLQSCAVLAAAVADEIDVEGQGDASLERADIAAAPGRARKAPLIRRERCAESVGALCGGNRIDCRTAREQPPRGRRPPVSAQLVETRVAPNPVVAARAADAAAGRGLHPVVTQRGQRAVAIAFTDKIVAVEDIVIRHEGVFHANDPSIVPDTSSLTRLRLVPGDSRIDQLDHGCRIHTLNGNSSTARAVRPVVADRRVHEGAHAAVNDHPARSTVAILRRGVVGDEGIDHRQLSRARQAAA